MKGTSTYLSNIIVVSFLIRVSSFAPIQTKPNFFPKLSTTQRMASMASYLVEPKERDTHYGTPLNVAKYLIDLHESKSTLNFCGGMMFQLVLSDKLRDHLQNVAEKQDKQPMIYDASNFRMFQIPNYKKNDFADNITLFHGREIRKAENAEGGMGMVFHLSLANGNDPEGWTKEEIKGYDGWGVDRGRVWRNGQRLEEEGFSGFREKFGKDSFALHHRCYLHYDQGNMIWLSAEDGCEGTPWRVSVLDSVKRYLMI